MDKFKLILCLLVILCTGAHATWPFDWDLGGWGFGAWTSHQSPSQERQDEVNDAEILKAVVNSMQAWERNRRDATRKRRADSAVCYDGVGCFMGSAPFSYLGVLPAPPSEVGTSFHFFSPREPHRARSLAFEEIVVPAAAIISDVPSTTTSSSLPEQFRGRRDNGGDSTSDTQNTTSDKIIEGSLNSNEGIAGILDMAINLGFNSSIPTKMIVHGFGSSCSHVWVHEMRSALMSVEECNIICVDWEPGASIPNYVRAAANTRLVGKQVALLLRRLRSQLGLDPRHVHLIGFSLGAHVAGFAGSETPGLKRITGLDPAGPLFESQVNEARLDATDAEFVDVIHSNGENLILGGLGSWQPMGHVDFYPNGGREQKGCSNLLLGAVSDITFLWSSSAADSRSLCNHRRAYKFFTDSISPHCPFPAFSCDSYEDFLSGECFSCGSHKHCGNMGYYADRSAARGQLYLITRDNEPFCAHQFYLRVDSTPVPEPILTNGKFEVILSSKEINETFTLTQKDDEVLESGESLTRLVVTHPVMVEPASAYLIYTAYNGWLSSGISHWSIDKLLIVDAFGKSLSFCKKGMILTSGVPLLVPLFSGDCNPPTTQNVIPLNNELAQTETNINNNNLLEKIKEDNNQTEVNEFIKNNRTSSIIKYEKVETENKETLNNEKDNTNQSNLEEYPLYLRPWNLNEQNNSLIEIRTNDNSRSLPLLDNNNSKDQGSWAFWWQNNNSDAAFVPQSNNQTTTTTGGNLVTVQMLPKRLANMLQQAEQYARATLSSVATTFIGGGNESSKIEETDINSNNKRRGKFFPPLSTLFGYNNNDNDNNEPTPPTISNRQDTSSSFNPVQIIKSQDWRISRYIPLRRYYETKADEKKIEENNESKAPIVKGPR